MPEPPDSGVPREWVDEAREAIRENCCPYSTGPVAPEVLEGLTPEERYQVYKMLKVGVVAAVGDALEVSRTLADHIGVSKVGTASFYGLSIVGPRASW